MKYRERITVVRIHEMKKKYIIKNGIRNALRKRKHINKNPYESRIGRRSCQSVYHEIKYLKATCWK